MKKYFFVAASAALVLSSCSNEIEQVSELGNTKKEIKVSTYTPGMTRATEAGNEQLQEFGFWLLATTTDSTIINNHYMYTGSEIDPWVAAKESLDWVPNDTVKYWPETGSVSFYGIYDGTDLHENPMEITETGNVIYEVSTSDQKDIMVASSTNKTLAANGQTVSLSFKHILAEVEVQMIGSNEEYDYTVYGVSVAAPGVGIYNVTSGAYDVVGKTSTFVINSQAITDGFAAEDETHSAYELNATEPTKIGESAFIVPKDTITLSLTYQTVLNGTTVKKVLDQDVEIIGIEAGKKNIINVTLTPGQLPIKVTATTTDWGSKTINKTF